jgi:ankyrin repeat protein
MCSEPHDTRRQPTLDEHVNISENSQASTLDISRSNDLEVESDDTGFSTKSSDAANPQKSTMFRVTTACILVPTSEGGAKEPDNAELISDAYVYIYANKHGETDTNRLVLLSVLFFLKKAMKELKVLCKEVSRSGCGTFKTMKRYREKERACIREYSQIPKDIAQVMRHLPTSRQVEEAWNSAVGDIGSMNSKSYNVKASDVCQKYWDAGHYGIYCALEITRMIDGEIDTDPNNVARFIQSRQEFLMQCVTILGKYDFKTRSTRSMLRSQLFLPKTLLQIPAILEEVHKDNRRDCLGRSAPFICHDAEVHTAWLDANLGDVDVIGRSVWYLASVRHDTALLDQLLNKHPTPWCIRGSSLDPGGLIHAAASKGYTAIFQSLQMAFPDEFRARVGAIKDERGLNCLHVAAREGHTNTVEYLCQNFPAQFVSHRKCAEGRTALLIAAMGGHVDVMSCLIGASEKDCVSDARDFDYRSAFWWAAWSGSVEGLKLLETRRKQHFPRGVDERDVHGNTPFAISIINSNFGAARYILSLNTSKKVCVDVNRDNMASQTPLDHANMEWDMRGFLDKELEANDKELEAFIAYLRTQGALTYDEMQKQEMWSEGEQEEDSECECGQDQFREEEPIDTESEDWMDVKSNFDSYFAQASRFNVSPWSDLTY